MPELPEVETVARALRRGWVGKRIRRVELHAARLREPLRPALRRAAGRRVRAIRRRGKYLFVDLSGKATMLIHLGMTGSLRFVPASEPRLKHDHVIWRLSGGETLRYHDPRRFGLVEWLRPEEVATRLQDLGPEPLARGVSSHYLWRLARGLSCNLKTMLLDQRRLAGIGNIYASESLFLARLDPRRRAASLTLEESRRLVAAIKRILRAAIRHGGTTISDFVSPDHKTGSFTKRLKIYDRTGQPCPRCRQPIRKVVIAGRSTFFCPACQKRKA